MSEKNSANGGIVVQMQTICWMSVLAGHIIHHITQRKYTRFDADYTILYLAVGENVSIHEWMKALIHECSQACSTTLKYVAVPVCLTCERHAKEYERLRASTVAPDNE